jgi:hypothetical protein
VNIFQIVKTGKKQVNISHFSGKNYGISRTKYTVFAKNSAQSTRIFRALPGTEAADFSPLAPQRSSTVRVAGRPWRGLFTLM